MQFVGASAIHGQELRTKPDSLKAAPEEYRPRHTRYQYLPRLG